MIDISNSLQLIPTKRAAVSGAMLFFCLAKYKTYSGIMLSINNSNSYELIISISDKVIYDLPFFKNGLYLFIYYLFRV